MKINLLGAYFIVKNLVYKFDHKMLKRKKRKEKKGKAETWKQREKGFSEEKGLLARTLVLDQAEQASYVVSTSQPLFQALSPQTCSGKIYLISLYLVFV